MNRGCIPCALLLLAAGCSENDRSVNIEQEQGSVFESQIRTIEKAEEIEQTLEDAAAKQRQAIEEQGG